MTFADSKTLITAGEDCVVSVYTVQSLPNKPLVDLQLRSSLFGHKTPVTHIAVSKAFSTVLTVSQDGVAFLWDLNSLEFIRKLPFARPVECAKINDVTGDVMLCSGQNVLLYTLNGEPILDQNVCANHGHDTYRDEHEDDDDGDHDDEDDHHENHQEATTAAIAAEDFVHACAFYEGSQQGAGNEWLENQLVFTGHRRGVVNVWRKTVGQRSGRWVLEFVRRLDHVNMKSETGANVEASITCIAPLAGLVYTGDDDGRVVSFDYSLHCAVENVRLKLTDLRSGNGTWFSGRGEYRKQGVTAAIKKPSQEEVRRRTRKVAGCFSCPEL